jgi:hypothetical protein
MTIDINEARKLADENERWCMDESARTIRALCDRVEAADEVIRASEWKSVDWTTNECPYCAANEDHGHKPDCKLAAWLTRGEGMSKDFWKGIAMLVMVCVAAPLLLALAIVAVPIFICNDVYKQIEKLGKEF